MSMIGMIVGVGMIVLIRVFMIAVMMIVVLSVIVFVLFRHRANSYVTVRTFA
jgi:hypothetical protein